jgi:hypothetical protein
VNNVLRGSRDCNKNNWLELKINWSIQVMLV